MHSINSRLFRLTETAGIKHIVGLLAASEDASYHCRTTTQHATQDRDLQNRTKICRESECPSLACSRLKLVSIDMSMSISLLLTFFVAPLWHFEATVSDLLSILHPGSRVSVPNILSNMFLRSNSLRFKVIPKRVWKSSAMPRRNRCRRSPTR